MQSVDRARSNENGCDAMVLEVQEGKQLDAHRFSRAVRAVLSRHQVAGFDLEFRHFGTGYKVARLSEVRDGVHPYLVKKSNGRKSQG